MGGRIVLGDGKSFPLSGAWMGWSDGALVLAIADAAEARRFADFAAAHATALEKRERIAAAVEAADQIGKAA